MLFGYFVVYLYLRDFTTHNIWQIFLTQNFYESAAVLCEFLLTIYPQLFQFRNQYDNDVTVWSPQGRIHQVEYAIIYAII